MKLKQAFATKFLRVNLMKLVRFLRMPYVRGIGWGFLIGINFGILTFGPASIIFPDESIPWKIWALLGATNFFVLFSASGGFITAWKQAKTHTFISN